MKLPSLNPSSLPALLFLLSLPALVTPLYFHIGETERKCFIEEIPDETMVIGTYAQLALRCKGPKVKDHILPFLNVFGQVGTPDVWAIHRIECDFIPLLHLIS